MNDVSAIKLSQEQDDIIVELINHDCFDDCTTRLMIIMSTGGFARVEDELIGILIEYPGMEDAATVKTALRQCIDKHYLSISEKQGAQIIFQDDDSFNKYLTDLSNELEHVSSELSQDIIKRIRRCRDTHKNSICVKNYGLLSGGSSQGAANTTFRNRLREAKQEILLPMFNTSAHTATIEILKERASKGVQIKILLADYEKVTKKVRRRPDTTPDWLNAFSSDDTANIEIRVFYHLEDCILSSSVVIDNDIVRLVVVDPRKEKTTNGTLIECHKHGYHLNITELVRDRFFDIWKRSRPIYPKKMSRLRMLLQTRGVIAAIIASILWIISFSGIPNQIAELSKEFSLLCIGIMLPELTSFGANTLSRCQKLLDRLRNE